MMFVMWVDLLYCVDLHTYFFILLLVYSDVISRLKMNCTISVHHSNAFLYTLALILALFDMTLFLVGKCTLYKLCASL